MIMASYENGQQVIRRWDAVFKALSAEPRRQLIVALLDTQPDQPVSLPEHAMNPNVPVSTDQLRTRLQHVHLPLLAELGFVEWESEPFAAFRGQRFEEVAVVFEALHATAPTLPESLVIGCQRLEHEREESS